MQNSGIETRDYGHQEFENDPLSIYAGPGKIKLSLIMILLKSVCIFIAHGAA